MTIAKHHKCGACGWVHFELSLKDAQTHTDAVNAAPLAGRKPVTVDRYSVCSRCGASSETFVPALPGDAPPLSNLRGVVLLTPAIADFEPLTGAQYDVLERAAAKVHGRVRSSLLPKKD